MSQKFCGIQRPIVVLGETCKWGGSMKAVWQDSACDSSLVRLMYSVMPHPSLKESHLQEHEHHVGFFIQASSSKRVKISKALSTLIPGRSQTCLRGSGHCLIKGVDPCRCLTHGCPNFWLTNVPSWAQTNIGILTWYMIVRHTKNTAPRSSECSSFTSTLNQSKKIINFSFGGSVSIYCTLVKVQQNIFKTRRNIYKTPFLMDKQHQTPYKKRTFRNRTWVPQWYLNSSSKTRLWLLKKLTVLGTQEPHDL